MLEPADSQECNEFVQLAFELSETYDIPVMVRLTMQTAHQKSIVRLAEPRRGRRRQASPAATPTSTACCRGSRGRCIAACSSALRGCATTPRRARWRASSGRRRGRGRCAARLGVVVAAGAAYISAREAAPGASFLKLGMVHPLPVEAIRRFAASVDRLFVVEELEPYLEEQILAAGIACRRQTLVPAAR